MNKKAFLGLFFALILFFVLVSDAKAQTVSGSIAGGAITRGKTARATVYLDIPGGLHTNSSRPSGENLIATRVRVSSGQGAKVGAVSYPPGKNKRFAFQEAGDRPLNVYEGRVPFRFDVTVPSNFKGNTVRVNVTVNFQACNDEVCFAPKKQEITLTARVR